MTAIRICLAALFISSFSLTAIAQAQTPPASTQAKPDPSDAKAKKREEIAREKAAVSTPLDASAALETRRQIKEKRAACKQEAKAKKLGFGARRAFMRSCEAT